METQEQRQRLEALVEEVLTQVKVIAEGHSVLVHGQQQLFEGQARLHQRIDRLELRMDARFDALETRVDKLEAKVDKLEAKVDNLEVFAVDAKQRLKRIETHLHLNGPVRTSSTRKPVAAVRTSKRRNRS